MEGVAWGLTCFRSQEKCVHSKLDPGEASSCSAPPCVSQRSLQTTYSTKALAASHCSRVPSLPEEKHLLPRPHGGRLGPAQPSFPAGSGLWQLVCFPGMACVPGDPPALPSACEAALPESFAAWVSAHHSVVVLAVGAALRRELKWAELPIPPGAVLPEGFWSACFLAGSVPLWLGISGLTAVLVCAVRLPSLSCPGSRWQGKRLRYDVSGGRS